MVKNKIIDHNSPEYRRNWESAGENRWNGAYYYSREIVRNIIPRVKTDRGWITINSKGVGCSHAVVFIHNNLHPENYEWLKAYDDLILVCGVEQTMTRVKHLGTPIYLPLSVDVEEVKKYHTKKTRDRAFAGRWSKLGNNLPMGCEIVAGLPRSKMLKEMAQYKVIYAVGRTAIEARVLGCQIGYYDPRYPNPSVWKILDNKDAAKMLQKELDRIDGTNDSAK